MLGEGYSTNDRVLSHPSLKPVSAHCAVIGLREGTAFSRTGRMDDVLGAGIAASMDYGVVDGETGVCVYSRNAEYVLSSLEGIPRPVRRRDDPAHLVCELQSSICAPRMSMSTSPCYETLDYLISGLVKI